MDQRDLPVVLVTGTTGLVGRHVVLWAAQHGYRVRGLVRKPSSCAGFFPEELMPVIELVEGDLEDGVSLEMAVQNVNFIVHCAAKVGDWGPTEEYRQVNVEGTRLLIEAARKQPAFEKFVHISSLGVFPARDHYGTDEDVPVSTFGIDGYTLTKRESEQLVSDYSQKENFPAVILRPGFIYGPGDRSVLPRLIERLKTKQFAFLGSPEKLMNNTSVHNLVQAVAAVLKHPTPAGRIYHVTDGRLVTKREFVETVARCAKLPLPKKVVPLPVAKVLAKVLERIWKLLGKQEAPLLSSARIKFLGLNLDFSSHRIQMELGYQPVIDFQQAMPAAVADLCGEPAETFVEPPQRKIA
ncbi:3 beta-hydroxysteroid dehydrogenase/Delta 5--_4-isomerase [Planctopirus ephydatiae]|uniref:3 beta-hydroxysteroid dehydrogenase/Delta 5-->4-isomerase n=1 Tax=Planctopirus ephydatiae TaxID=2528019 RepID=A0A518GKK5_9PLAN|nr:NAD-dependent epimerase/dehydratase family protein [Planctopirus ephydatiae]QDV29098.1 3 beta-hydroxysteroid dehydrogenase/Delta 5-->4-isomerase [Planctopirus ephydatiae]